MATPAFWTGCPVEQVFVHPLCHMWRTSVRIWSKNLGGGRTVIGLAFVALWTFVRKKVGDLWLRANDCSLL
jgi:hypothetical protein